MTLVEGETRQLKNFAATVMLNLIQYLGQPVCFNHSGMNVAS
jgi:hypothetical protein